tara:strand:- start:1486 stop:2229 length:744 start_codon:yes stop_codon:yes gene_type:complete
MKSKDVECHLVMHTACMCGNFFLYFMGQHEGFLSGKKWDRATRIDKFWGEKSPEPLHLSIERHNLWQGAIGAAENSPHQNTWTVPWDEHVRWSYLMASKLRDNETVRTFTKLSVKPNLLHNVKHAMKENVIQQLIESVMPECVYLLGVSNPEHYDRFLARAEKLRPYDDPGLNDRFLFDNLLGQREHIPDLLKLVPKVETIDVGKILFDVDEQEYHTFCKHLKSPPLEHWREIIKEYTDKFFPIETQ